jgi:hypothetical protein
VSLSDENKKRILGVSRIISRLLVAVFAVPLCAWFVVSITVGFDSYRLLFLNILCVLFLSILANSLSLSERCLDIEIDLSEIKKALIHKKS